MKPNSYQAAVLSFLFDRMPIGEEVDTFEFALAGAFSGTFRAAHAALSPPSQGVRVVFNLPTYTRHVFLALTVHEPAETARVLANLEDYERESRIDIAMGDVVAIPDDAKMGMPHAVMLLRTASALDCAEVPDQHEIGGTLTAFSLALPISAAEFDYRRQHGHDALLDKFEAEQKSLYF